RDVEAARRRQPGACVDARGDGGVEVEILAVLETAHGAVHLRPDALKLAPHLGDEARVVAQRLVEELAGVTVEVDLVQTAPAAAVVVDVVVPLVVAEIALVAGL